METGKKITKSRFNIYLKYEITTLLIILIFFQLALPALAQSPGLNYYQDKTVLKFDDWKDEQYTGWKCNKMAPACEEFFETQMRLDSYLIYGHGYDSDGEMTGHVWVVVMINGEPEEFEATSLQFKQVSEKYIPDYIQEGRYIQGVKQDMSTSVTNTEILETIIQSLTNI